MAKISAVKYMGKEIIYEGFVEVIKLDA